MIRNLDVFLWNRKVGSLVAGGMDRHIYAKKRSGKLTR